MMARSELVVRNAPPNRVTNRGRRVRSFVFRASSHRAISLYAKGFGACEASSTIPNACRIRGSLAALAASVAQRLPSACRSMLRDRQSGYSRRFGKE
jgi:hypothetical protein